MSNLGPSLSSTGLSPDRLIAAYEAIFDLMLARLKSYIQWEYTVYAVHGTGPVTVDCQSTDPSMPDIPGVVLWPGPDGAYSLPAVGSLVTLGFTNGDMKKPRITSTDPNASPTQVFLSGTGPAVARNTDPVSCTGVTVPVGNGIIITAPSGGGPCVLTSGPGPTAYELTGTITGGSPRVQSP